LEQHLPEGSGHPFAKTMLEHFQKQTPLRCLKSYNTIESQNGRFLSAGWRDVETKDLWSLWQDPGFASPDKAAVESIEPFDEWEELALFAGHYFLLMATTSSTPLKHIFKYTMDYEIPYNISPSVEVHPCSNSPGQGLRRFGASFNVENDIVAFHGGLKSTAQQSNCDIYTRLASTKSFDSIPDSILCHTITKFDHDQLLLVGGRNSPAKASSSCFLYENNTWTQTHDLLPARYRHCSVAVKVDSSPGILTFGGKTSDGRVLDDWTFFDRDAGWQKVEVSGPHPLPLFGASMATTGDGSGFLVGGMSVGGHLHPHFTTWELSKSEDGVLKIQFESKLPRLNQVGIPSPATLRFGASIVQSRWGILLIGGIGPRGPIPYSEEILVLRKYGRMDKFEQLFNLEEPRPLLVGCGAATIEGGNVLVVGGSAVCFSFGAFWNQKSYLICPKEDRAELPKWRLMNTDQT
jgi:tRNA wybutosine-synthesizing protein 4